MGGVDITSTAYSNGLVTIAEVTGNIVTAESKTTSDLCKQNGGSEF